jgi:nucleotide sugar dehydrogenase
MKLGIVGQGFVGNAVYQKFKKYYEVSTFDLDSSKANSTFESVAESDYVFVCLPTPMNEDGSCNTDIVEGVIKQIDEIGKTNGIVVKSTIPPTTTEKWNERYKTNIVFNPEFLTERNAVSDYENQNRIILGGPRPTTTELKQIFSKVFPKAHIIKTNSTYAEMVKYVTNTFLSVKVSFANEIYQLCNEVGADYDKVIEYATMDERLGDSHWGVPGHDGDFGFGGHCFPKDLAAFLYLTKELGTIDNVLSAAQRTNDAVRWDRDWEKMEGRAVSKKSDNHTKNNSVE